MMPSRGCSVGSTTNMREVPSALGWPGQSAANAVGATLQANSARASAAQGLFRTTPKLLPIMKQIPSSIPISRDHCILRHECSLNCSGFTGDFGSRGAGGASHERFHMDDVIVVIPEVAQERRQHRRCLSLRVMEQDDSLAGGLQPLRDELEF